MPVDTQILDDLEKSVGLEQCTIRHWGHVADALLELTNDLRAYNQYTKVKSGFTEFKVSQKDVGTGWLEYLSRMLGWMKGELSNKHYWALQLAVNNMLKEKEELK